MKALKICANGDGNPVCPPSKVICRECLEKITTTLENMVKVTGDGKSRWGANIVPCKGRRKRINLLTRPLNNRRGPEKDKAKSERIRELVASSCLKKKNYV